jgi:hypothetical protein
MFPARALRLLVLYALLTVVVFTPASPAQTATATLAGSVRDQSAAVIPGAEITVTNLNTNLVRKYVSDEAGKYIISALPPGPYSVLVQAPGFGKFQVKSIELQVDQRATLDVTMSLGAVATSVSVEAETALLQSARMDVGQVIENRKILELPLNGRQFLNLAALVAGANTRSLAGRASEYIVGQRGTNLVSANGARNFSNSFLLDGTFNTDGDFNTYVISPSVDAIQEFKVQTSTYSAEFGRAGGGQINVVTKSGTTQLRGSVYEFLRNDKFDAKNYFDRADEKIPPYRQNQFGLTLGGPVKLPKMYDGKDKTFFFGSYEGMVVRQAQTALSTVPTGADRSGDFSSSSNIIYDPLTGRKDAEGKFFRDPFPSNRILANRVHAAATGLLNYLPGPNLPGTTRNYLDNRSHTVDQSQFSARVDQKVTEKNNAFVRYSYTDETEFSPRSFPGLGENLHVKGQQLTLSDTHILSPRTINDFRFGFNRFYHGAFPENAYVNNIVEKLGLQNLSTAPIDWGVPEVSVTGFTTFGDSPSGRPSLVRDNVFQWVDTVVYTRGKHTITAGGEARRFQFNNEAGAMGRGSYAFDGSFTSNPAIASSKGTPIADFLLGVPRSNQFGSPTDQTQVYFRQTAWSLFIQDDFKIMPALTLNLGLRYEYSPPLTEKYGRVYNVEMRDVNNATRIVAPSQTVVDLANRPYKTVSGSHDFPDRMIEADFNDFGPRVGLAYNATKKTVIRTGYGIFYDQDIANKYFDLTRNVPRLFRVQRTSGTQTPELDLRNTIGSAADLIPNGFGMDPHGRTAYIQQWNFTVQRLITPTTSLEAAYVGSKGTKLSTSENLNIAWPPSAASPQTMRPNPLLSTAYYFSNNVDSNYHSLQLRAEKKWSHNLSVLSSYAFSKAIDDGVPPRGRPGSGEETTAIPFDRKIRERGISGTSVRHRSATSLTYQLPFGPGQKQFSAVHGVAKQLISDWHINVISLLQSGAPFSIGVSGDRLNVGISRYQHVNAVAGVSSQLPKSERTTARYFNTGAFVNPPLYTVGTLGRNTELGPSFVNFDFSVIKRFPIWETHRLEFRSEFFNVFNHPNWGLPGSSVGTATLGQISSATASRQIQLALKYTF